MNVAATARRGRRSRRPALPSGAARSARPTTRHAATALAPRPPRFKLVYAYPADRPDRFASWQDALQANVALIQRFLASQSGGTKALRVDMGTSCGPQYVDLQVVQLSGPRSRYIDDFRRDLRGRGRGAARRADGPRNATVLADTLNGGT